MITVLLFGASNASIILFILLSLFSIMLLLPADSLGHDTEVRAIPNDGKVTGNPVHQHITKEARHVWESLPSEIRRHLLNNTFTTVDPYCSANYDAGYDDMVTASAEEDQEWYPILCGLTPGPRYTAGFMEHFWNPDEPNEGGFAAYDKGFSDPILFDGRQFASAYRKAQEFWDRRVICHYTGLDKDGNTCPVDKEQAYYWLGRVAHLLEDLTVPAHIHGVAHDPYVAGWVEGGNDPFEEFAGSVFRSPLFQGSRYRGTEYRHEKLPCVPTQQPATCTALEQNFRWTDVHPNPTNLFKLLAHV